MFPLRYDEKFRRWFRRWFRSRSPGNRNQVHSVKSLVVDAWSPRVSFSCSSSSIVHSQQTLHSRWSFRLELTFFFSSSIASIARGIPKFTRYVLSVEKMCVIQRGLVSEAEGANMTLQVEYHGGASQLGPNQCFEKIKTAGKNVFSRLRALFQVLSSICFRWEYICLFSIAFMLTKAHGEEETGLCKLMDPAIIWDLNSLVNPESRGLCPCSSTQQLPMQGRNICVPQGHRNMENHSPDPLGPPIPSRANVKVVVVTVLAIIGGIGLAGRMLNRRWPAFTEADINAGLMSEPAVPKRSDPTFEILPSF